MGRKRSGKSKTSAKAEEETASPYFTQSSTTTRRNIVKSETNSKKRKHAIPYEDTTAVASKCEDDVDSDFEPSHKKTRTTKPRKPRDKKKVASKQDAKQKVTKVSPGVKLLPKQNGQGDTDPAEGTHSQHTDSDDSESDWEEVEDLPGTQTTEQPKSQIPEQPVEITLEGSNLLTKKKKKKKFDMEEWFRLNVNKTKRQNQMNAHKVHILCLLACGMRYNDLGNDPSLQGVGLSLIPASFLAGSRATRWGGQTLSKFVRWFSSTFEVDPELTEYPAIQSSTLMARFVTKAAANELELVLLFLVVCRCLGIETRFVYSIQPMTSKAPDLEAKNAAGSASNAICIDADMEEGAKKSSPSTQCPKESPCKKVSPSTKGSTNSTSMAAESKKSSKDSGVDAAQPKNNRKRKQASKVSHVEVNPYGDGETTMSTPSTRKKKTVQSVSSDEEFDPETIKFRSPKNSSKKKTKTTKCSNTSPGVSQNSSQKKGSDYWTEVYLEGDDRWICVDCIRNRLDHPEEMETLTTKPMCYVLGFDSVNNVKDLTKRYAPDYLTHARKQRADVDWWDDTMALYRPVEKLARQRDNKENQQMEAHLMRKPMPTNINAFKNHPLYALKRHMLKYEALYPESSLPLGFVRGEAVYARDCIHTLHSRENWLKEARLVRIGETPYKLVKSRKPVKGSHSGDSQKDQMVELFGRWQTEDYIPPPAVDGKVPRNEYGNVELFLPSMLPMGTVHLRLPGLNKVARKLDIDCASAMVGWEHHGGFSCPMMDGFVVCEEFEETLVAAWEQDQEIQRQKEFEKKQQRVLSNWKLLVKGLLIRERMKKRFKLQALEEPKETDLSNGEQTAKDAEISWPRNRQEDKASTSKSKGKEQSDLFPFEVEKM